MKRMLGVLLAMSFGATFVSPLFPLYSERYGLSGLGVTALFAVYALFVLPSLLIAGSRGGVWGLKKVIRISMGLSLLSTLIFMFSGQSWPLYAARVLEGIAIGCFTGTASAFLLRITPKENTGSALKFSGMAISFGFGLGPAVSGMLIQYIHFKPLEFPFWTLTAVLAAAWAALETLPADTPPPGAGGPLISLGVPEDIKAPFRAVVALPAFAVFTLNGIVLSLISTFAKTVIHTTNLAVSGWLILLLLGGGALAQLIPRPVQPMPRLLTGLILLLAGAWIMVIAGERTSLSLLWTGITFQAIGSGWAFQTSLRLAGTLTSPETRAKAISTFYFAAYTGSVVPIVGVGVLTRFFSLNTSLLLLNAAMTLLVLHVARYSVRFHTAGLEHSM